MVVKVTPVLTKHHVSSEILFTKQLREFTGSVHQAHR